jgi:hypothetical protein
MKKHNPFLITLTVAFALFATGCASTRGVEKPHSDLAAYENQKLGWRLATKISIAPTFVCQLITPT